MASAWAVVIPTLAVFAAIAAARVLLGLASDAVAALPPNSVALLANLLFIKSLITSLVPLNCVNNNGPEPIGTGALLT